MFRITSCRALLVGVGDLALFRNPHPEHSPHEQQRCRGGHALFRLVKKANQPQVYSRTQHTRSRRRLSGTTRCSLMTTDRSSHQHRHRLDLSQCHQADGAREREERGKGSMPLDAAHPSRALKRKSSPFLTAIFVYRFHHARIYTQRETKQKLNTTKLGVPKFICN